MTSSKQLSLNLVIFFEHTSLQFEVMIITVIMVIVNVSIINIY